MATKLISIPGQKQSSGPETFEDRVAQLELRLQDGFARIGEAMLRVWSRSGSRGGG